MEALDYWRLCDEFSLVQAALLIVEQDPSNSQDYIDNWAADKRPVGYDAAIAALAHATSSGRLKASVQFSSDQVWDTIGECMVDVATDTVDRQKTTILLEDLKVWLRSRGFQSGFFFPSATNAPAYLEPEHPRYAPKLAATVSAWLELEDESLSRGRTPKQALVKWLREHAADFNLSDEEGKPNETGIEECAKVANWQEKGGAPRTPTTIPTPN